MQIHDNTNLLVFFLEYYHISNIAFLIVLGMVLEFLESLRFSFLI